MNETTEKIVWWRYPVGIIVCIFLILFAPTAITWIINTFSFFISGFFYSIILLFGIAIATAIGFFAMTIILPKHQYRVAIIVGLVMSIFFAISAILFYVGQNPLVGTSYIFGIVTVLISIAEAKSIQNRDQKVFTENDLSIEKFNIETKRYEVVPQSVDIPHHIGAAVEKIMADNKMNCPQVESSSESNSRNEKMKNNQTEIDGHNLFCRKCGNQLPADSDFCYKCGSNVIRH